MSRTDDGSLYDHDVTTWASEQKVALAHLEATGAHSDVDWTNVARTIAEVGQQEFERVRAAVATVLGNAQRGYLDPDSYDRLRWQLSFMDAGFTLQQDATLSVRRQIALDDVWNEVFDAAVDDVRPDLTCGIPPGLPARSPFTWDDITDEFFTYEKAVRRLYEAATVQAESADP